MKIKFNNKAKPFIISILLAASFMPLGCTNANNEQTIEKPITNQEALISEDAPVLQSDQIAEKAKELTLLIEGPASSGSGVLIQKEGNKYVVATAWHVIKNAKDGEELTAKTYDGKIHKLDIETGTKIKDVDLATIKFTSNKKYNIAIGGRKEKARTGKRVYVSGYPLATTAVPTQLLRTLEGKVISNTSTFIPNGYQLLYTNPTLPGMSGGPVFDEQGGLAGIHGQAEIDSALTQREGVSVKTGTNQAIPISYLQLFKSETEIQIDPNEEIANSYIARASNMRRKMAEHYSQLTIKEFRDTRGGEENPVNKALLEESINLLTKAIEAKESSYAYYLRAMYRINKREDSNWYSLGQMTKSSREDLEKAIELDQTNAAAIALLAVSAGVEMDWDKAREIEDEVMKKHFPKWYDKSLSDFERRGIGIKTEDARRVIIESSEEIDKMVLDMNPNLLDIEKAIDLDPYKVETYLSYAGILYVTNRKRWIIDVLEKGIKHNPNSAILHFEKGQQYYLSGLDDMHFSKALKAYDQAIKLDPSRPRYYEWRGKLYDRRKEYSKAIEDFEMAVSTGGTEDMYKNLAYAYANNNEHEESIKVFYKRLKLPYISAETWINTHFRIAHAYLQGGDKLKACELIHENIGQAEGSKQYEESVEVYDIYMNKTKVKGYKNLKWIDWLKNHGSNMGLQKPSVFLVDDLLKACSQ